jgi:hypothetical protein
LARSAAETAGIVSKRASMRLRILRAYVGRSMQAGFEPKETMA